MNIEERRVYTRCGTILVRINHDLVARIRSNSRDPIPPMPENPTLGARTPLKGIPHAKV